MYFTLFLKINYKLWSGHNLSVKTTIYTIRKIWNKENDQSNKKWNNIVVVI
jgi:hypothetical protein